MLFIRVRDPHTRHEFDLPGNHPDIESGLVELVNKKAFPPSEVARPPKHFVKLDDLKTSTLTANGGGSSISKESGR